MKNRQEPDQTVITVMTCRDARQIFEVLRDSAKSNRRRLPPGVGAIEDVVAVMRGGVAFFVAYVGAEAVGAIGYRWERGTLRIFHVAVKESHQRCGVARRLVQAVESVAFALGSTSVSLEVGREFDQHLPFERFGYAPARAEERPESTGGRVLMRKALRDRTM